MNNEECLICFEDCNETVPCCNKNIHIKCLNSFWQFNKHKFNICPHCNSDIKSGLNIIVIPIETTINDNDNNNDINNNDINNNKKCLIFSCSSFMFLLFLIVIFSYF
jgi:hypothetical protein